MAFALVSYIVLYLNSNGYESISRRKYSERGPNKCQRIHCKLWSYTRPYILVPCSLHYICIIQESDDDRNHVVTRE